MLYCSKSSGRFHNSFHSISVGLLQKRWSPACSNRLGEAQLRQMGESGEKLGNKEMRNLTGTNYRLDARGLQKGKEWTFINAEVVRGKTCLS